MAENFQIAVLKNINGKVAVLQTETGVEILWPTDNLPQNARIGGRLYISLSKEAEDQKHFINPKEFLNSILSSK